MALRHNLLHLLETQPVNKISVSELCALSDINRSTFYKYYNDPMDLLKHIENGLFGDLENYLTRIRETQSLYETILAIVRSVYNHKDFCKIQLGFHGDSDFFKKMMYLAHDRNLDVWQRRYPHIAVPQLEYLYTFMAKGGMGIIEQWAVNGFLEPPDYIAHLIEAFCLDGIRALLDSDIIDKSGGS